MSVYQDEKKYSSLARIMKDKDYVIIDTCSLMEDSFPEFLDILEETKKEYLDSSFSVYILESSMEELKRHSGNREQKDKKIAATQALRVLAKAKKRKTVDIIAAVASADGKEKKTKKGESEINYFADVEIISKITLDRTKYETSVITQDKKLASDLLALNKSQSVHGSKVVVYKIEENATLSENKGEDRLPHQRKASTSVLIREESKPSKAKAKEEQKAAPRPAKVFDYSETIAKIVANDKKIHSGLANSQYSRAKLKIDIMNQIADIKTVPAAKLEGTRLIHDLNSLSSELNSIDRPEPNKAEKPAEPQKKSKTEGKDGLWYEYGQTVEEAFKNVGSHYGIIFRDPGVPYVKGIHGPANFTTEDLTKIAATYGNTLKKEGQRIIKQYRSVYLMAERTPKGIKAWIDIEGVLAPAEPPVKTEPSAEAKPSEPAKPQSPSPVASAPASEAKAEPKKPKKTAKKAETSETKAEKKPEKKPKAAAKPADTPKEEKKVKEAPAKKANPAKKETKKLTKIEEAIASEAKLKANINNPNYSLEQKASDIEAQIALIKKIPLKERVGLSYDLNALKTFLTILKK